jgi:hypothetical protein
MQGKEFALVWIDTSEISFSLRQALSFDWGNYIDKTEDKSTLFKNNPALRLQASRLLDRSKTLQQVWMESSSNTIVESLTYFNWLLQFYLKYPALFDELLQTFKIHPHPLFWLDAGAKNWSYVYGLVAFMETLGINSYHLDGVELDVGRRLISGHTRGQVARTHAENILNATYHPGSIQDWAQPAQIITSFLPFVFEEPHCAWGLPKRFFQPMAFLEHLACLLIPQTGLLLVVNQGEEEAQEQEKLFQMIAQQFPIAWHSVGALESPFMNYRYTRYGWLCQRIQ